MTCEGLDLPSCVENTKLMHINHYTKGVLSPMLDYLPPITEGDSPMSHHKLPSLAMCHEFSARVSLSKIAATAGETASAEDRT